MIAVLRTALFLGVILFAGLLAAGVDWLFVAPIRASDSRIAALKVEIDQILDRKQRAHMAAGVASPVVPIATWVPDLRGNANDATTRFQEVVRDAISAAGGSTLSSQANASEIKPGLSKITILLRARFNEISMLKFVEMIESETPSLKLESFEARPVPGGIEVVDSKVSLDFSGVLLGLHQYEN